MTAALVATAVDSGDRDGPAFALHLTCSCDAFVEQVDRVRLSDMACADAQARNQREVSGKACEEHAVSVRNAHAAPTPSAMSMRASAGCTPMAIVSKLARW